MCRIASTFSFFPQASAASDESIIVVRALPPRRAAQTAGAAPPCKMAATPAPGARAPRSRHGACEDTCLVHAQRREPRSKRAMFCCGRTHVRGRGGR